MLVVVLIIGQLSFAFAAVGFWLKDMKKLRYFQIASACCGLVFHTYMLFNPTAVGFGLASVIGWLVVFLALNLIQLAKIKRGSEDLAPEHAD